MTKLEYLVLELFYNKDFNAGECEHELDSVGDDGWELVQVSPDRCTYFFKRVIREEITINEYKTEDGSIIKSKS